MPYTEARNGQILEEGITEAGAMSSFVAAGTAYATHGVPTIPFYIYYSMFGFQRIGDLAWAAGDLRCKGFMLGATAGRTTLNGEGLQHEDGHSHVLASTVPNLVTYDPTYAYELALILQDGIRRMYGPPQEDVFYYITLYNDNYAMSAMPPNAREGVLKGMYKLRPSTTQPAAGVEGAPLRQRADPALRPACPGDPRQRFRRRRRRVERDELPRDAPRRTRNRPLELPPPRPRRRASATSKKMLGKEGPKDVFVAASDYMRTLPEMIDRWVPGGLFALGTDGYGRSESRGALRRHFEVDAECIALAALYQLSRKGHIKPAVVQQAIAKLGIDPEKISPMKA